MEQDRMEQDLNFVLTPQRGPMIIIRGGACFRVIWSVQPIIVFRKIPMTSTQVVQYLTQLVERLLLCLMNLIRAVVEGEGFVRPVQAMVLLDLYLETFR